AALGQAELLPGDEGGDDGVGAFEDAAAAELFDDGEDGRFFPAELLARQPDEGGGADGGVVPDKLHQAELGLVDLDFFHTDSLLKAGWQRMVYYARPCAFRIAHRRAVVK